MIKIVVGLAVAALVLAAPAPSPAECPDGETIVRGLGRIFRNEVKVEQVRPAVIDGLCEVIVTVEGKQAALHSDPSGRYVITTRGQIVDVEEARNVTGAALAEYNRFTGEELKKLETLTAFSIGEKGPLVYYATDPQ